MDKTQTNRQQWGSRLGIIMAVAGSAIGLGNFLRFPAKVAENGGGASIFANLDILLFFGFPILFLYWRPAR